MSEAPDIVHDPLLRLSPEERAAVRSFIDSPLWRKYLSIVTKKKPSAFCTGAMSETRDAFSNDRANARLGEIRGWELYHGAIFLALMEPAELKKFVEESYPDEARLPLHDQPGTAPSLSKK